VRCLVLLTLLPAIVQARARDLPAHLTVKADTGAELCPKQEELAHRVEAILHRQLGKDATTAELAIEVRFERSSDGSFVARVAARGSKPGQRLLRDTDPTCGALGEAVSVAIALLLDSATNEASAAGSNAQPEPPAAPTTPPATPADKLAEPTRSSQARRWAAHTTLEAGGAYGLGGSGSLLGFGRLGARHGSWLFDLGAGGNLPSEQSFDGGSVRTSLIFASLRACYLLGRSFALGPCLQLGAGRLHGAGSGYGQVQSSSLPWTAGALGLAAVAPLDAGLYATFGSTLWLPTRRQTFSVENAGIAWESKPVAFALTAGLGLTLF